MNKKDMNALLALIDKAEHDGKWLFCSYQSLWFSPAQLRYQIKNGYFRWGVVNWQLRDHKERIGQLEQAEKRANEDLQRAYREMPK